MSHVWSGDEPGTALVATKGAPEAIARLCGLNEAEMARLGEDVAAMADRGLRVLGVASGRIDPKHCQPARPGCRRSFSALSALPIRCATACRRRLPNAARPASAW